MRKQVLEAGERDAWLVGPVTERLPIQFGRPNVETRRRTPAFACSVVQF
jgi:hypothetical protein